MRLFIAIIPPAEIQKLLREAQDILKNQNQTRINWTTGENFHLTVKFLGEVPDGQVSRICSSLSSAKLGDPFRLNLSCIITLPPHRPARVIAATLTGEVEPAARLAENVDQICHDLGFPLEARPFKLHITIGRLRGGKVNLKMTEEIFAKAKFSVEEIVLMSSDLSAARPVYAPVARFELHV